MTNPTDGGFSSKHDALARIPIVVAPTTENGFNTFRAPPVTIACWRVEDIRFDFDSSFPAPEIATELGELAKLIKDHPDCPLSIYGHSDPVGNDDYNKILSGRRAAVIYGLLTRNTELWESLYFKAHGNDNWQTSDVVQRMLDRVSGMLSQDTTEYKSNSTKRKQLFLDYMNRLCGPNLKPLDKSIDFLARGADPNGKGDYHGCSELNPAMLFSQEEEQKYQQEANHNERNRENSPNRRVMVFLFRKGSRVDPAKWPCPPASEGLAGCKKRLWSKSDERRNKHLPGVRRLYKDTKDTFACRFYDRLVDRSPCELVPPVPVVTLIHMFVDADRDGKVDDDWKGNDKWEWGVGKKGAIILCNNDDDDKNKTCDNEDNKINGSSDVDDLAPLVIRRSGVLPPSDWKGYLEVSEEDRARIRIFDSRTAAAKEIIGPSTGKQHVFTDLDFAEKQFGMEASTYPNKDFSGEITIIFRIEEFGGKIQEEKAVVRVAPWVIFNHYYETTLNYVVQTSDNANFLIVLKTAIMAAGIDEPETAAGVYARDRWIQDAMEIGFSTLPTPKSKAKWNLPVVLRTANDRDDPVFNWGPIDQYPKKEMMAPGYGFTQALPPTIGDSMDSFGNLECSPPFKHSGKGKDYKFGRIVYGIDYVDDLRNMRQEVRDFLHAQKVQHPFKIDTGWLIVGHVDEVISFCPMIDKPKHGFRVLIASPDEAVNILTKLKLAGHGSLPLFENIEFTPAFQAGHLAAKYPLNTVDAILGAPAFMDEQRRAQAFIKGIRGTLKTELDLDEADFIDLPILFSEVGADKHIAYTPGVVNSLVLTKSDHSVTLCMPKPFGPKLSGKCQFEEYIEKALGPESSTGIEIEFIDDFATYHQMSGEIHCGTNSKRRPPEDKWWWEQDI